MAQSGWWMALLLAAGWCGAVAPAAGELHSVDEDRFELLRRRMVERDIVRRGVTDQATLEAMRKVPRHRFVPPGAVGMAYDDRPLPIGHGQTISQPYIVAYMTEQVQPRPDQRILEIGTGSGYQAAVLAEIVGEVYSIEIVQPLAERVERFFSGDPRYRNISVRHGDGYHGWPGAAPFDAIVVTAASETIPPPLIQQLKDGGRMIIPVGPALGAQHLVLVTKEEGRMRTRTLLPVRFVPFTRVRGP